MTVSNAALVLTLQLGLTLVCEAFFYGCYTVLFAVSVYLMFHRPRRGTGVNKPIIIISGFLYLSCSAHIALEFIETYELSEATHLDANVFVFADILISVTDFLGQLILIYRCWLLWSRNYWVIILPSLLSIASIVCYSVELLPHLLRPNQHFPAHPTQALVLSAYSLPLGTNVIVTTLIAGRIWFLSPCKPCNARSVYWEFPTGIGRAVIDIVIESGMLYLAVQLIFVISYAGMLPSLAIVTGISVQIYGIASTLIIIRASLCVSNMQPGLSRSGPPSTIHPTVPMSSTQVRMNTEPGYHLQAEMLISEIKSKPGSEDIGLASSSMESVTTATV